MNIKVVNILWEKYPFALDEIKKLDQEKHHGLYQIYADHPVYGLNRLIYIGKANQQTFSARLGERQEYYDFIETILNPTYLHIGMLAESDEITLEERDEMIDKIEVILIKSNLPALNASGVRTLLPKETEPILVLNWEEYGELTPEASSIRVSYKYWDNTKILSDKHAKHKQAILY